MSNSNRDETSTGLLPSDGCALPALACEARDLKRIMAQLASQIADTDRRHTEALAKMQQRLEMMGDATGELREQLPDEMSGVLDRIEGSMAQLSDRMTAKIADVTAAAQAAGSAKGRGAATESAPALRSALAAEELDTFARRAKSMRVGAPVDMDNFDVVDMKTDNVSHELMDPEAADLLARLYETSAIDPEGAPALDAVTAAPRVEVAVEAEPAGDEAREEIAPAGPSASVAGHASKGEIAAEVMAMQAAALEGQKEWLEDRLGDVARRLEQSIAGINKADPLNAFEERFSKLEQKLTEAMTGAVKSADLAGLKSIESQVEDLNAQFVSVQTHFSRLDTIELDLRSLAERMTGDEFAKLFEQKAAKSLDPDQLSSAVASRVEQQMPKFEEAFKSIAAQLSADKIASIVAGTRPAGPDAGAIAKMVADQVSLRLPSPAPQHSDPTARLEDLRATLEAFVAEQRHGEAQTSTLLDTMQQAMIKLLDRMDAIEQVRFADDEQPTSEADAYDAYPSARGPMNDAVVPHAAFERSGPELSSPPVASALQPPLSAHQHAQVPPSEARPSAPSLSTSALRASVQHAAPSEPEPFAPTGGAREDYIAAARRAARMAAEAPAEPDVTPESAPPEYKKRSAAATEKSSARKLSPVSMALICLMLIGVSFVALKATVFAPPNAPQPAVQSQGPQSNSISAERIGIDKRIQNLEDADGQLEGGNARRGSDNGGALAPRRSSLQSHGGGDERDLIGQEAFPPADGGRQQPGTQPVAAALTKDAPSAAAAPRSNDLPPLGIGPNSLRTAAAKGDASAEFEVGARFAEGRGVTQDLQQAVNWYTRSASQGFAPAQYRLGSMFERGLGVKADMARARVWYQRAAEQGIVKAMHNLAVLSAGRDTTLTDYQAAGKWFRAAADYGLTDSQFNLAIMHDSGLGMERDAKQAYKWFSLAARAGDEEAARRRESLRQKLLPQEVTEVEAEVAGWRPKAADQNVNDTRLAGEAWKNRAR